MSSSETNILRRHANLITALTEFYTTFVELAIVPPWALKLPDATTGVNPTVNVDAITEAGFTREAAEVLARIPYIDEDHDEDHDLGLYHFIAGFEVFPSSTPIDYAIEGADRSHYEFLRYMDDAPGNFAGSLFRLTRQELYGIDLLYHSDTCLMREWQPFEGEPGTSGYEQFPAKLPTEILRPWIERWRKLEILWHDGCPHWNPDLDAVLRNDDDEPRRKANQDYSEVIRDIRKIYAECGWQADTAAGDQQSFDRERFLRLRKEHQENIVEPLKNALDRIVDEKNRLAWEMPAPPHRQEL